MRAGLLVNAGRKIPAWQRAALVRAIDDGLTITKVFESQEALRRRIRFRNAAYYLFALIQRPFIPMLRRVKLEDILRPETLFIQFTPETEGAWQRIPGRLHEDLADLDILIRFGMGLIRDPDELPLRYGILSYHHGDPAQFRGRPAGFYEIYTGSGIAGVVVQQLTNSLDGGRVLAGGFARVEKSSYRKTLNALYEAGIPMLTKAIRAIGRNPSTGSSQKGTVYSLPSNRQVMVLILRIIRRKLLRILYGLFAEKRWLTAHTSQAFEASGMTIDMELTAPLDVPRRYTFVADPVGHYSDTLYCEAMNRWTGRGEILAYCLESWRAVDLPRSKRHYSFPQHIEFNGDRFLFPEVAQQQAPTLFQLDQSGLRITGNHPLIGLERLRLLDSTLFFQSGYWYLFGGEASTSGNLLRLWTSRTLFGPWVEHPESPICIDPRRARMAGCIIANESGTFRLGQENSESYGRAIIINRITELTPHRYAEQPCGEITVSDGFGPHTVTVDATGFWFDYYRNRITPMAGVRRILAQVQT